MSLRFSRGARVVLLGAFPATFLRDFLILETRDPAVLVLVCVSSLANSSPRNLVLFEPSSSCGEAFHTTTHSNHA